MIVATVGGFVVGATTMAGATPNNEDEMLTEVQEKKRMKKLLRYIFLGGLWLLIKSMV